jgi:fatty acid desaturase
MIDTATGIEIGWYRTRLEKDSLKSLTARTDWQGLLQVVGYLALLCLSGAGVIVFWGRGPWYVLAAAIVIHGTFFAFLLNGFHELVHGTVFKSKWLNAFFLRIFSFLSWNNPVAFRASHTQHHLNTLHPPHDLEVVLPIQLTPAGFLLSALVDVIGLYGIARDTGPLAFGRFRGAWQLALFPASHREGRRRVVRWARIVLLGHALIVAGAAITGLWQVAVVLTAARFYGLWLHWLCNNTQHIGLQDNVPDFRLCCRTIRLNPFVRFLYFHMNFHTEHHMYASVPCYKLGSLRRTIAHDMPRAKWLVPAWIEIIGILRRQKREPSYQFVMKLPETTAAG